MFDYSGSDYPQPHQLYRHYKGGEYMVLAMSTHTETKEPMVVYVSLTYGTIWTRPLKIWNEFVQDPANGGMHVPRFNRIERRTK